MSTEENRAIFRRYAEEVTNKRNLEVADEIFDRYRAHQPDGSVLERGPEDVKRFQAEVGNAFHNLHATIEDQIAEGDKVVTRYRIRGIHQGEFRGIAPTGKQTEFTGISIFRFSNPTVPPVRNDLLNTACCTLIEESRGCEDDQAPLQGA